MGTCDWVHENLTAWIDGELPMRERAALQQHLETCGPCTAEARDLRAAIGLQRRVLGQMTGAGAIETEPLWRKVRLALVEAERPRAPWWGWLRQPFAMAGATVAAALLILLIAGGPRAILVSLGIESPPTAVAREPELFKDYPLIEQLDALEHFDTVQSVPLDEEPTSQNG
jgi:anti-sigma factor RsiW